ncbi:MAG TPA: acyl-CoA dehydrogenase family protein [Acidimicrobiales bacterium]|nr:acyl-CoA dehydrogenase family protein [Acidimicrobiales bacterium]
MDLRQSDELVSFRAEAGNWLESHAPAKGTAEDFTSGRDGRFVEGCRQWQAALHAGGWAGIAWPIEHGGRGQSALFDLTFARLAAAYGVSTAAFDVGIGMVGPTLMVHGSPEQKQYHLPALLRGEHVWCQMFSEPGSGSDLASLSTAARPVDGGWMVNGAKVWTSYARFADYAILLARSDPERPRHRGITCFVVDMTVPGIEVRPISQMNGMAEFNQVYLTDVFIPDRAVVGDVHDGWSVANTMLGSERGLAGAEWPGSADLVSVARRRGTSTDPLVRQRIAEAFIGEQILRFLDLRVQTRLAQGAPLGPLASIVNLSFADHLRRTGDAAAAVLGPDILVAASPTSPEGRWQFHLLTAPSVRIASGTDEIQRNILGERALGLPRDPRPPVPGGAVG